MHLPYATYEHAQLDELAPVVIALHGWGANALDLLGLAPFMPGVLMICPQGEMDVPGGGPNAHGWFPLTIGSPPDAGAIDSAIIVVERFIEEISRKYSLNRRKIALMGFSQGGVVAYGLALRNPARFAALAAISTWMPDSIARLIGNDRTAAELPILIQHGRRDELIDMGKARQALERLQAGGFRADLREYDCGHEITMESLRDMLDFMRHRMISHASES
jgi:phospholipase/carboxylesterase